MKRFKEFMVYVYILAFMLIGSIVVGGTLGLIYGLLKTSFTFAARLLV